MVAGKKKSKGKKKAKKQPSRPLSPVYIEVQVREKPTIALAGIRSNGQSNGPNCGALNEIDRTSLFTHIRKSSSHM